MTGYSRGRYTDYAAIGWTQENGTRAEPLGVDHYRGRSVDSNRFVEREILGVIWRKKPSATGTVESIVGWVVSDFTGLKASV
jgi:hypothetical protein